MQPLKLPPGAYEYPRLSPDGKRIAVGSDDGKDANVWIYEVSGRELDAPAHVREAAIGARSGPRTASASRFSRTARAISASSGSALTAPTAAERLTKPDKDTAHVPESWSPDGKTLLFSVAKGSSYALAALSLPDKKVTPFGGIQSPFPPAATFSPDGRWVAYSTWTAPGPPGGSLFVQPFPTTGATYPISKADIGFHPTWSPDGKELFYFASAGDGRFVAVSVTTRPTFTFGNPVLGAESLLSSAAQSSSETTTSRSTASDSSASSLPDKPASGAPAAPQIQVVLNWHRRAEGARAHALSVVVGFSSRNGMKIGARLREWRRRERRDRRTSGEVEAGQLADPERACLSE